MKLGKRIISIMLAAAMCITTVPLQYMPAYAAETSKKSGTCGKNLTWVLNDSGTLTISGTGKMTKWDVNYNMVIPWNKDDIKTLIIEDGVTDISAGSFSDCNNLESVYIPDSVIEIGDSSFAYCYRIRNISLPKNLKIIGERAFSTCRFSNVLIPGSVTSIGDYAFESCTNLTSISIPEGVTSIGEGAFLYTNIENIEIPASVSEIGDKAFLSDKLQNISVPESSNSYRILDNVLYSKDLSTIIKAPVNIESHTIPDSVKTINNYAFYKCNNLENISIPDSVISIGDYALEECGRLSGISVSNNLADIGIRAFNATSYYYNPDNWENGALYMGNYLIDAKDVTGDYNIKEGTVLIGGGAFMINKNVTGVTFPDSLVYINKNAFDGCNNLKGELKIPDSVVKIGKCAFRDCQSLTGNLTIPNSGIVIEDSAFEGCRSITGFTIPDSNIKLGNGVFTQKNNAILNIVEGPYKPELDFGIIPFTYKEINYKREILNYNITDNTNGTVHYAEKQAVNVDFAEYNTYSDVTSFDTWDETDKLQEAKSPDGRLFAFYGDKDFVTVVPENNGQEQIKITNEGFIFGAATIGDDGYYYIMWGKSIPDDIINNSIEIEEENVQVCKYDNSGKLIKTLGLPVSYTRAQFPFHSSNANISYNKGFLCVIFGTKWTTVFSDSIPHHQGSEFIGINAETMELAGFDGHIVSHEFGISMIPTDYGFAAVQRGDDGETRGISIGRYYLSDNKITRLKLAEDHVLLYHSSGQYGTNAHHLDGNCTYVYMGGLAMSNSTYAIAGKSERIYTSDIYKQEEKTNDHTGIYDVFVRIADLSLVNNNNPDFAGTTRIDEATGKDADYNMIWLTQCNEKEKAANVKIVKLPDGSYCVLWEKMIDGKFDSIRYVVLDECGNTLRRETAVYGARLSCTSIQPIVQGNTLSWAVADKKAKTVTWYSVDLDKHEEYNESKVTEYKDKDKNNTGNDKNTNKNTGDNNAEKDNDIDKNNDTNGDNNSTDYIVKTTGTQIITRGMVYNKISGSAKKVQFAGTTINKGLTSLVIPSSVKISGKVYKVISVADNALKGMGKLKKLEIGANIEHIGKGAFNGCKNLKRIVIKSKKLTLEKTGSNAFKGINSKAVIKVPKSRITSYKKIIYVKGAGKSVKVK